MSKKQRVIQALADCESANILDLYPMLDTGQDKKQLGIMLCNLKTDGLTQVSENRLWSLTEKGERWLSAAPKQTPGKQPSPAAKPVRPKVQQEKEPPPDPAIETSVPDEEPPVRIAADELLPEPDPEGWHKVFIAAQTALDRELNENDSVRSLIEIRNTALDELLP